MKCLILVLSLFLTVGCQKFAPKESTADMAQRMLDERNYSGVIEYLEKRQLNTNTSGILMDAYIGASGFETISFLEQVELVLSNSVDSEHPVDFLHESFRPLEKLNEHHRKYLKRAVELGVQKSFIFKNLLTLAKLQTTSIETWKVGLEAQLNWLRASLEINNFGDLNHELSLKAFNLELSYFNINERAPILQGLSSEVSGITLNYTYF